MIEGMLLGLMSFTGFAVTYSRLHPHIKLLAIKWPIATDLVCVAFFYSIMGMTIPAHFAVATMSVMMMAGMHVERNKQDYLFVYDVLENAKTKMRECREKLRSLNEEYKQKHHVLKAV